MTCDPSVVVQLLSCVQLFVTPWTAAHQASLSFTISRSLLKLMSIESVMPSNHLILCCPFLLLPSISPASGSFPMSQLFTSGGQSIGASASIDWFGLLAVQGTLKSLLQHHSSKASILWLSLLYGPTFTLHMTTGKTIALISWTFVGKVMSLLFNTLSRFVIAFFPRSKIF